MSNTINATSSSATSLLAAISEGSFDDGGDIAAKLEAIKAAGVGQQAQNLKNAIDSARIRHQQLNSLYELKSALPQLSTLGDGTTVALGQDTAQSSAMLSQLAAAGQSLQTSQSCYIQVNGGPSHIATPGELAAANQASLTSSTSSPNVETRVATGANNNTTTYMLYKDQSVATASKASVTALAVSITAELPSVQRSVEIEDQRLAASIQAVQGNLNAQDVPRDKKVDLRSAQDRLADQQGETVKQDITDEIRRQFVLHRDDLRADGKSIG